MASGPLSLFLTEGDAKPDAELAKRRRGLLRRLESILASVILEDAHTKKEAKTWLVASIAKLNRPNPSKLNAFLELLPKPSSHSSSHSKIRKPTEGPLLRQLVLLVCENRSTAPKLGRLFSRGVDTVKRFFAEDEGRVRAWFGHFAAGAGGEHSFGAKALARYAIVHRDECWEELEWAGAHPQAPGTVASKPHYYAELDVVRTVHNFQKHVPDFWTSNDWRDCLSCGEFLALDPGYFAEWVVESLEGKSGKRATANEEREFEYVQTKLREFLKDFLAEEPFSTLCQRLLHFASPEGLLSFLERLQDDDVSREARNPQLAAVADVRWRELHDGILCNACAANGRQVVRLLNEDEFSDKREQLEDLIPDASTSDEGAEFRSFRSELRNRSKSSERKLLILESWLLRWRLTRAAADPRAMQRILELNGIAFRPSVDSTRELLRESPEAEPERIGRKRNRRKRRRKRHSRTPSEISDSGEGSVRTILERNQRKHIWKKRSELLEADTSDSEDIVCEADSERTGRKRKRKQWKQRNGTESMDDPSSDNETKSDSERKNRHKKRRHRKGEEDSKTSEIKQNGRKAEVKAASGSESDSFQRSSSQRRQGTHLKGEGGGGFEDEKRRKGSGSGGSNGALEDADGVYLQTDGFEFRWSLMELPDHLAEHSLAVWLGWKSWLRSKGGSETTN